MARPVETFVSWQRLIPSLGLIGLLITACAQGVGTSSGGTPSELGPGRRYGGTVIVRPQDAGRTTTLEVGDILVFSVSNGQTSARSRAWHLLSFPRNVIHLISRSPAPPFRFRAVSAGNGELRLTLGSACGSPGPMTGTHLICPVGESSSEGGPPGVAIQLLTFPLKVLPRGQ